ncbi:MAG: NADH-quinone oxidoreductase subunit C [Candidatus Marsarchaeota archaeon]|nr:NADH-quinone oxidoreductase subunit C [Candidatus Marsarchaeota archaeon]
MKIERNEITQKISAMKAQGYSYLIKITAVDYEKYIEIVYMLRNMEQNKDETLEVDVDPSDAWIPTVIDQFDAADWYERELFEMFGVQVKGRHVERLLLEKWDGKPAPLRKNFVWNGPYETGS